MNVLMPSRGGTAGLLGALLWLAASVPVYGALAGFPAAGGKPTLAPLLQGVTPTVVNIAVTSNVASGQNPLLMDPFFRRFFQLPDQAPVQPRQSAGSGVIVDARSGRVLSVKGKR